MRITESSRAPLWISVPIFFALAESSRPCTVIQMLCQPSMTTATPRIDALKSSWPMPWARLESTPAPAATASAPRRPTPSPPTIQRVRPSSPRVAAPTMPRVSAASRTSRKTMRAVPNMLFRDDHALGGLLGELADERVLARLQWTHEDRGPRLARDHLLDLQRRALELFGRGVLVFDDELHLLAGGYLDSVGDELVALDGEAEFGLTRGEGAEGGREEEEAGGKSRHRGSRERHQTK